MSDKAVIATGGAFAALRRLAQPRPQRSEEERCDLCSIALAPRHRHLFEVASRKIVCACDACALRFEGVAGGRFKLVPRDPSALPDFQITDQEWAALGLPIALAFFSYASPAGKMIAMYPSPAGATEALLPLDAWEAVVARNAPLNEMQADVEALLVNRVSGAHRYFIAPIDLCYELVGTIRMHWRGFSGGDAVWSAIDGFFARLADA